MSTLLEMREISKTFPGVRALDNVTFSVEEGEIHALVGENGAGKSTLMKVLSGVYPHGNYEGEIYYDGELAAFAGSVTVPAWVACVSFSGALALCFFGWSLVAVGLS